jgi:hypothetical protein
MIPSTSVLIATLALGTVAFAHPGSHGHGHGSGPLVEDLAGAAAKGTIKAFDNYSQGKQAQAGVPQYPRDDSPAPAPEHKRKERKHRKKKAAPAAVPSTVDQGSTMDSSVQSQGDPKQSSYRRDDSPAPAPEHKRKERKHRKKKAAPAFIPSAVDQGSGMDSSVQSQGDPKLSQQVRRSPKPTVAEIAMHLLHKHGAGLIKSGIPALGAHIESNHDNQQASQAQGQPVNTYRDYEDMLELLERAYDDIFERDYDDNVFERDADDMFERDDDDLLERDDDDLLERDDGDNFERDEDLEEFFGRDYGDFDELD